MMTRIETLMNTIATLSVVALCLLITANVAGRIFFGAGVPDAMVLVRELMVPAILFPLASATAARAHVAIEVVAQFFPPALARWMAVLAALIGLVIVLPLLWAGWREFTDAFGSGALFTGDLGLPKWPGRALFVIALTMFALRLMHVAAIDLAAALRGRDTPRTDPQGS